MSTETSNQIKKLSKEVDDIILDLNETIDTTSSMIVLERLGYELQHQARLLSIFVEVDRIKEEGNARSREKMASENQTTILKLSKDAKSSTYLLELTRYGALEENLLFTKVKLTQEIIAKRLDTFRASLYFGGQEAKSNKYVT